jgi:hypothetical protein
MLELLRPQGHSENAEVFESPRERSTALVCKNHQQFYMGTTTVLQLSHTHGLRDQCWTPDLASIL